MQNSDAFIEEFSKAMNDELANSINKLRSDMEDLNTKYNIELVDSLSSLSKLKFIGKLNDDLIPELKKVCEKCRTTLERQHVGQILELVSQLNEEINCYSKEACDNLNVKAHVASIDKEINSIEKKINKLKNSLSKTTNDFEKISINDKIGGLMQQKSYYEEKKKECSDKLKGALEKDNSTFNNKDFQDSVLSKLGEIEKCHESLGKSNLIKYDNKFYESAKKELADRFIKPNQTKERLEYIQSQAFLEKSLRNVRNINSKLTKSTIKNHTKMLDKQEKNQNREPSKASKALKVVKKRTADAREFTAERLRAVKNVMTNAKNKADVIKVAAVNFKNEISNANSNHEEVESNEMQR